MPGCSGVGVTWRVMVTATRIWYQIYHHIPLTLEDLPQLQLKQDV